MMKDTIDQQLLKVFLANREPLSLEQIQHYLPESITAEEMKTSIIALTGKKLVVAAPGIKDHWFISAMGLLAVEKDEGQGT